MQFLLVLNFGNVCLCKRWKNIAKVLKERGAQKKIGNIGVIKRALIQPSILYYNAIYWNLPQRNCALLFFSFGLKIVYCQ